MADTATARVALLSIHPGYAEAILEGRKQVEFRRRPFGNDVTHVVLYATAPVKQIVGAFEVEAIDSTTPSDAWQQYHEIGGVERTAFDAYYDGTDEAHVIRIRSFEALEHPVPLSDIDSSLRAPQSFIYLRDQVLARAVALLRRRSRHPSALTA